jgi:CheY-like chemotaxis protein
MQAGLLKMEANLSLEQKDFAGEIEKAAERGANLTRQLLLFSRQQTMQPRDLKLNETVENMAKMLRRTLGEQFDLQFQFAPEPLYLHADPGMIDQILLNLTVNARDAMPKGGQILIETSAAEVDEAGAARNPRACAGTFVCLRVTDHGSGIAPEILPRIFEPFFTTKGIGKGTGLGLATVFGIVQQHKGWIDVSSEVGQGTTFRVYLPRLKEKSDTEIIHRPTDAYPGGGETILIVEDEAPLRDALRVALKRLGYRVLEATSGDEALALWENHRDSIRVVLTDLVMPGNLSGKELGAELLRQNPRLKIIYASGYSQEIAGGELPLAEGFNYLAKPFDSRKLAQVIRHNLDLAD